MAEAMFRRSSLLAVAALAMSMLVGCSAPLGSPETDPPSESGGTQPSVETDDPIEAAVALVQQRYELVRDRDYEGACALYSEGFAELFAELAEVTGATCVEAHNAAALNVETYLGKAEEQQRAGLTPFFYVPSAIEIDRAAFTSDDAVATIGDGAVKSLDLREFEDGVCKTPGWLAGLTFVKQGDDGQWRFIAPNEQ